MSSEVEAAFVSHLLDVDSLSWLMVEGFNPVVLPTPEVADLWVYAQEYYIGSDGTSALSLEALATYEVSAGRTWVDVLIDLQIDPEATPELTISDVVLKLQSQYVLVTTQRFNRAFAEEMATASTSERLEVAQRAVGDLVRLSTALAPRREYLPLSEGIQAALEDYRRPKDLSDGLRLGVPEIDNHFLLVQPGEMMVFGAGPKMGKSLMTVISLLAEWAAGRRCVLFTLENSIKMTVQRIVCAQAGIDSLRWQKRECDEAEVERVEAFATKFTESGWEQFIVHPSNNSRDPESLMARAVAMEAQSVIIDQVSHVHHPDPGRKPRHEVVRDIVQSFKELANGTSPMSVMLMSQINREGVKAAASRGFHILEDYAESSELEKSADFALSLYQSRDMKTANMALIQTLAARRVPAKSWNVDWYPALGSVHYRSEFVFDEA